MTSVSISLRSDVLIFVVSQPSWNKVSQWLHFLEKQLTIFITDASYWKYKESMNCVGGHNAKTECKEVSISWLLLFLFLSFFLLPVLYSTWAAFFNPAHTILPHQAVKFHCSFVKVSKGLSYESFDRQAFSTLSFTWLTNHNVSSIHV